MLICNKPYRLCNDTPFSIITVPLSTFKIVCRRPVRSIGIFGLNADPRAQSAARAARPAKLIGDYGAITA